MSPQDINLYSCLFIISLILLFFFLFSSSFIKPEERGEFVTTLSPCLRQGVKVERRECQSKSGCNDSDGKISYSTQVKTIPCVYTGVSSQWEVEVEGLCSYPDGSVLTSTALGGEKCLKTKQYGSLTLSKICTVGDDISSSIGGCFTSNPPDQGSCVRVSDSTYSCPVGTRVTETRDCRPIKELELCGTLSWGGRDTCVNNFSPTPQEVCLGPDGLPYSLEASLFKWGYTPTTVGVCSSALRLQIERSQGALCSGGSLTPSQVYSNILNSVPGTISQDGSCPSSCYYYPKSSPSPKIVLSGNYFLGLANSPTDVASPTLLSDSSNYLSKIPVPLMLISGSFIHENQMKYNILNTCSLTDLASSSSIYFIQSETPGKVRILIHFASSVAGLVNLKDGLLTWTLYLPPQELNSSLFTLSSTGPIYLRSQDGNQINVQSIEDDGSLGSHPLESLLVSDVEDPSKQTVRSVSQCNPYFNLY
jgi:hypothetical protein